MALCLWQKCDLWLLVTESVSESVNCLTEKIEAALGSQRVAESNATNVSANTDAANDQPSRAPRFNLFDHPDRIRRRVPKDWEFPKLNLQHMYLLWHCGNESQNVSAIKLWDSTDVNSMKSKRARKTLSEMRRVMRLIDEAAKAGGAPHCKFMSHSEIITCYNIGKSGIKIPMETASGRRRVLEKMSWTTILRQMNNHK